MVSQLQPVQQIPDIAELPTGQELEVLGIAQVHHLYTMATIGLVLLTAVTPTVRGMSTTLAASSATTSITRTTVCALPFQSRLRSSQSNNQKIQTRLWI